MKVLHLLGFAEDQGGVMSVIRNLQAADIGRDWSHTAWVQDCYQEVRTPSLNYRYSRFARDGNFDASFMLNVMPALLSLRRLLKREPFDIIHAHSRGTLPLAVLVTKFLRRPAIYTNHNYARRKGLYRWASQQDRMYTVVLTPNMASYYDIDTSSPTTRVIPAFCADRFFEEPLVQRRACYSPASKLRLVGVGMITEWKSWLTVCQALDLLEPEDRATIEFTHWGELREPEYGAQIDRFIHDHGLDECVRFMGPTDRIGDALHEADWLVHPAIMDPFPVAVIEALALGLPALVTNTGGPVDMVKPRETGLLFKPNDAAGLANEVRAVLKGEVQALPAEDVRESVRHISASRVASRYYELYADILGIEPSIN